MDVLFLNHSSFFSFVSHILISTRTKPHKMYTYMDFFQPMRDGRGMVFSRWKHSMEYEMRRPMSAMYFTLYAFSQALDRQKIVLRIHEDIILSMCTTRKSEQQASTQSIHHLPLPQPPHRIIRAKPGSTHTLLPCPIASFQNTKPFDCDPVEVFNPPHQGGLY